MADPEKKKNPKSKHKKVLENIDSDKLDELIMKFKSENEALVKLLRSLNSLDDQKD